MKKKLFFTILPFIFFVLWTISVSIIDVRLIGPNESKVGFSTINGALHDFLGVNMSLYVITDWLGLVPVAFGFVFAVFGLIQLFKRKSLKKVDFDLIMLGVFYILVAFSYIIFEIIIINFRPVLINGVLEVSYPSSTTLLTLCVMETTRIQLNKRIKNIGLKNCCQALIISFMVFMVFGRLLSGVHWFSDIIGGVLLSLSLVNFYRFFARC